MKKILAGLMLLPGLLVGQQARQMARASTGFGDSSLVITSDTLSSKTTFVTKAVSLAQVRKSLSKFAFDSLKSTGPSTLSGALTYGGVTLSNAVTGTGNMVLSASPTLTGTITAAAVNLSGIATSTQSGGGANSGFYVNAASPSFGLRVSGGAADEKVWDITGSTNVLSFRAINDAASGAFTWMTATRTGISAVAVAFQGAVSGITTLATSGNATVGGYIQVTTNTAAASGTMTKTATLGLNLQGVTGSVYDLALTRASGGLILGATTGTSDIVFAGSFSGINNLAGTGAISGFTSATFSGGVNFTKGTGSVLNGAAVHITKGTGAGLYLLTALPTGAGSAFSYLLTDDGATTSVVALASNVNWTVAAGVSTDLATITNASGGPQTLTYSVIRLYSTF